MTVSPERLPLAPEVYSREQDASRLAGQIAESLADDRTDGVHATTALFANELLGLEITEDDEPALGLYLSTGDKEMLWPIATKAVERISPAEINNYPLSKARMVDNFSASGLRPLVHLARSLVRELDAGGDRTEPAIKKVVELQLGCFDLLNEKPFVQDLASATYEEVERNRSNLAALARIAEREGVSLDVERLMKIQPVVFEVLTSNDPITTEDVNYRKRLNAKPRVDRSLQAPELPNPDKLLSRYGDYFDFVEATAATKRGGYASTFGFLHRVCADENGNPFIVEYPHTMFEKEILNIDHPISDKLKSFERDFQRTHDMLHNALPVYADHFLVHHPSAPITLGGYLPDYVSFGKGMRKDKSSYELGLAILHKQAMQEQFAQDPSLLADHVATVGGILDDLTDLQTRALYPDEAVDHVSFVVMSAAMNILSFNSTEFQELLNQYDRLDLPEVVINPRDVYKLLIHQELVTVDEALYADVAPGLPKDRAISEMCKQIDDVIAVDALRDLDINYTNGEQGAESIIKALAEMGIEPVGMDEPLTLKGRERLRWIGITASSRRLKGFNEKIHGLDTVRFWDEASNDFVDVAPVVLLGKFYDHFQQHADEYSLRVWFRGLSDATLSHFKDLAFEPTQGLGQVAPQGSQVALGVFDKCMRSLLDDEYEPLNELDRSRLVELADHLGASGHQDTANRLQNCMKAYEELTQEATRVTGSSDRTISDARRDLEGTLKSLDG